jgi:hypothetical protein
MDDCPMKAEVATLKDELYRLRKVVLDGNGQPSLVSQISSMKTQVEFICDDTAEIRTSVDNLPKKLLTYLSIFGTIITIIVAIAAFTRH